MTRWYRGVLIHPRNYCGMYSARMDVYSRDGVLVGVQVAADTLAGIKALIRDQLATR